MSDKGYSYRSSGTNSQVNIPVLHGYVFLTQ
jgi:hypothetical protein